VTDAVLRGVAAGSFHVRQSLPQRKAPLLLARATEKDGWCDGPQVCSAPDGEPVNAGKPAPVAANAAAIDAAQAHPLTRNTVIKRVLAVAVAGAALYLALPKLIAVLGAWPRLSTLNPAWFTVCLAAELASFTCTFALQRLALRTRGWFPVVTAGLTGNAVTNSLPGGSAAGAAVQFRMLTTAGFDTDTAVGGLTAFSLFEVGGLLALPVFALPAVLAGVPVSRGLAHAAPRRAGPTPPPRPGLCHDRRDCAPVRPSARRVTNQNSASIGATSTRSFTASASCRSSVIKASASSWVRATYSASDVSDQPSWSATCHAAF
jgi:hypothetical protein